MNYLFLLITIIAVTVLDYLLFYCLDDIRLWPLDNYVFPHSAPTVFDLNDPDTLTIDRYVHTVICPAHEYFQLRNELLALNRRRTDSQLLLWVLLEAASFFILEVALTFVFIRGFISLLLAALLCGLLLLLSSAIYQKIALIPPFLETTETMEKRFTKNSNFGFPVSYEVGVTICMIDRHYNYLLSIRKTLTTRATVHNVISFGAALLYLLYLVFRYNP